MLNYIMYIDWFNLSYFFKKKVCLTSQPILIRTSDDKSSKPFKKQNNNYFDKFRIYIFNKKVGVTSGFDQ